MVVINALMNIMTVKVTQIYERSQYECEKGINKILYSI